jgi:CHASE3 domain sensor protein
MLAVAKKPKDEKEKDDRRGRRTAPVQVDKDLARMCAVIASHDGVNQADVLRDVLRPFLEANYKRVQQAIEAELKARREA